MSRLASSRWNFSLQPLSPTHLSLWPRPRSCENSRSSVTGRESLFHTWRAVEVTLGGVGEPRQDERAGLSLDHRALLVVQDVLDQAARRLLYVCVFLWGEKNDTLVKKSSTFFSSIVVAPLCERHGMCSSVQFVIFTNSHAQALNPAGFLSCSALYLEVDIFGFQLFVGFPFDLQGIFMLSRWSLWANRNDGQHDLHQD